MSDPRVVPVGEPPTPEGWPRMIYVCSTCGRIREQPWRCEHPLPVSADGVRPAVYRWTEPTEVRVAPVGGTGQEPWSAGTREAVRAALLPYLSVACSDCGGSGEARDSQAACRFCSGTGTKRGLSAVIDEAVDAALAGVGGTGVRLTDEEAKAGVYALGKAYGGNLISGPQHSLYNKLGKLLAASVGEGAEDG